MLLIDKLAYSSPLRRQSPALKLALAVGALMICVAVKSIAVSAAVLLIMGGLVVWMGKVPLTRYLKLLGVPILFILMGTLAVVVNFSPARLDLWNLPIGTGFIAVSRASLLTGGRLVATALAGVSCLYFLTLTTPVTDLLMVLRRLHIPWIVLELMLLIYRYIFVLLDMASAILTAQKCRLGNGDLRSGINGMGKMLAVLLVRALQKSSRLYDAMESRLYDGEIRVLDGARPASIGHVLAVCGLLLLLAAGAFFALRLGL